MREKALEYNKVESGEYVKPKSWAKQGQRDIICRLYPDGKLIIEAELSDYSVIWYSETMVNETELNAEIFDIIKETCYEENREWYCSPLYKILAGIKVPYSNMEDGMKVSFRVYRDKYTAPGLEETPCSSNDKIGTAVAAAVLKAYSDGLAKCKACESGSAVKARLSALDDKVRDAFSCGSDSVLVSKYDRIRPEIKEVSEMEYLKLSSNPDFRNNYISTVKYANSLYNRYMTIVR